MKYGDKIDINITSSERTIKKTNLKPLRKPALEPKMKPHCVA